MDNFLALGFGWGQKKTAPKWEQLLLVLNSRLRLLAAVLVTVAELVHPTSGVHQFHLTGVEGVAYGGDFHLDQGIFNPLNFDGLARVSARTRNKIILGTHVLEYTGTVIVWMNVFLHFLICLWLGFCPSQKRAAKIAVLKQRPNDGGLFFAQAKEAPRSPFCNPRNWQYFRVAIDVINAMQRYVLLFFSLVLIWACRPETPVSSGGLSLRFSADTLYLDTVFTGIGSSTYSLKVYNDHSEALRVGEIRLKRPDSPYRININGLDAPRATNVEILPGDSIYIFVEVTASVVAGDQMLVEDHLLFSSGASEQEVPLVTLAYDAYFHRPNRFLVLGQGPGAQVLPYSIIDCQQGWPTDKPHVVYGYAVVDSGCVLNLAPGTEVHFHENSGLWVFSGGELQIATDGSIPPPLPGQGDSVTFSGDRLEPFYRDAPGQWGGILGGLYIGQGAKAEINNLVLKNAVNGLRVDSATDNSLVRITNSYILNCSRTAFNAGYSNIEAYNLTIANSGLFSLYAFGGNYEFRHCTFANFWTGNTRREPAVYLTNFVEFTNAQGRVQRIVRDLEKAYFGNCIIFGSNRQELGFGNDPAGRFEYQFNHALLRLEPDAEDRGFSVNNGRFSGLLVNSEPDFVDRSRNRYALDSNSQAVDQGNVSDGFVVPTDIRGRNRNFNGLPDLGAYERQF